MIVLHREKSGRCERPTVVASDGIRIIKRYWDGDIESSSSCEAARASVMTWPSAGAFREESNSSGGQASKSIRWMPWHQEAMKDVVKLR